MFFNPLLGVRLCVTAKTFIRNVRTVKPSIKIGREKFQLTLDLRQFNKDELSVKAHTEYVIIEGKQTRETTEGVIIREFSKKYKLPKGCRVKEMSSWLSPEGILTVKVPRTCVEPEICEMTTIPIVTGTKKQIEEAEKKDAESHAYPCAAYSKVKPKEP